MQKCELIYIYIFICLYIYDSTPWAAKPGALQLLGEVGSRGMMWDMYIYIYIQILYTSHIFE